MNRSDYYTIMGMLCLIMANVSSTEWAQLLFAFISLINFIVAGLCLLAPQQGGKP